MKNILNKKLPILIREQGQKCLIVKINQYLTLNSKDFRSLRRIPPRRKCKWILARVGWLAFKISARVSSSTQETRMIKKKVRLITILGLINPMIIFNREISTQPQHMASSLNWYQVNRRSVSFRGWMWSLLRSLYRMGLINKKCKKLKLQNLIWWLYRVNQRQEERSNLFITGVNTLADYFLNRKSMNDETAATSIEHRGEPSERENNEQDRLQR